METLLKFRLLSPFQFSKIIEENKKRRSSLGLGLNSNLNQSFKEKDGNLTFKIVALCFIFLIIGVISFFQNKFGFTVGFIVIPFLTLLVIMIVILVYDDIKQKLSKMVVK